MLRNISPCTNFNKSEGSPRCTWDRRWSPKQSNLIKIDNLRQPPGSNKVAVYAESAEPKALMNNDTAVVVTSALIGTPLDAPCISINYPHNSGDRCYIWLGPVDSGHWVRRGLGNMIFGDITTEYESWRPIANRWPLATATLLGSNRSSPCSWPNLFKSVEFRVRKRRGVVSLLIPVVATAMCKYVLIAALAVMVSGQLNSGHPPPAPTNHRINIALGCTELRPTSPGHAARPARGLWLLQPGSGQFPVLQEPALPGSTHCCHCQSLYRAFPKEEGCSGLLRPPVLWKFTISTAQRDPFWSALWPSMAASLRTEVWLSRWAPHRGLGIGVLRAAAATLWSHSPGVRNAALSQMSVLIGL